MKSLKLAAITACLIALCACATLGKVFTPANAPLVAASVDIAVAVAVGNDRAAAPIRAGVIRRAALDLLAVDTGNVATVLDVEKLVNDEVRKLNLPPVEAAAVNVLTAAFTSAINSQIQAQIDAKLTPDTKVIVADVLRQVITATNGYAVPAGS